MKTTTDFPDPPVLPPLPPADDRHEPLHFPPPNPPLGAALLLYYAVLVSLAWRLYPYAAAFNAVSVDAILVYGLPILLVGFVTVAEFPWGGSPEILMDEEGLSVGRYSATWDELDAIECGSFFPCDTVVRFRLNRDPVSSWSWSGFLYGPQNVLQTSAYPALFRDVIPRVRQARPGLSLDPRLHRFLADPDLAGKERTRLGALAFLLPILLYALLFGLGMRGCLSSYPLMFLSMFGPAFGLLLLGALVVPVIRDERSRMLRALFTGYPMTFVGWNLITILGGSFPEMASVLGLTAAVALLGLLLVCGGPLRRWWGKAAFIGILFVFPALAHSRAAQWEWPNRPVPGLGDDNFCFPMWGKDGRHAIGTFGASEFVYDAVTGEQIALPPSSGERLSIAWLDERMLIRVERTRREDTPAEARLTLTRIGSDTETLLREVWSILIMPQRCVSPDRRLLAWVEREAEEAPYRLRVWDLEAEAYRPVSVTLPREGHSFRLGPTWVDDAHLVVTTCLDPPDALKELLKKRRCSIRRALCVLRISVTDGVVEERRSRHRATDWQLSPDFRYAYAEDVVRMGDAAIIDLESDTPIPWPREHVPLFEPSGESAIRLEANGEERRLVRVDLQTGEATPICGLDPDLVPLWLSHDGRLCLLGSTEVYTARACVLQDLVSGRRRVFPTFSFNLMMYRGDSSEYSRYENPFSPDDRRLLLLRPTMPQVLRTFVYTLPPSWRAGDQP